MWAGKRSLLLFFLCLLALAVPLGYAQKDQLPKSPLSPEDALKTFQVSEGFKIELVAAEPHVMDPVAFAWDADGRLYVVEMGDYPSGPVGGKVKLLEDTDGDGTIDRSTVFADKLPYPTGVFPWRDGVLVTAAPDIAFLRDNNGDGDADIHRVVFRGFGEGNQQHRVNGLIWGLDHWIYGANGDSGGAITTPELPKNPGVDINGRDFRIRPDQFVIEPVSGHSQFGISFDDWGRRFVCNNRVHIRLVVLPERYLKRNPNLAVKATIEDVAEYGAVGAQVYPASQPQERFNDFDNLNHFTSACAIHIYRGGLFPKEHEGNAFVCEPVHNLVHRCTLHPNGPSLVAKRAEEKAEFLTSTDQWCRPVFLATGPDGALYVADYYRAVIEHPKWIPEETQKRLDLRAGADRGRIYRILPKSAKPGPKPQLSKATSAELVKELANPNAWWRDTAQRLLYERQDLTVVPALREMATQHESAQARLRALWTLEGLNSLQSEQVVSALKDRDPGVRVQALQLAERRLADSKPIQDAVLALVNDQRVQFQLALTLGDLKDERAVTALARIAEQEAGNAWFRAAVLSSIGETAPEFVEALAKRSFFKAEATPAKLQFTRELATVIGARGKPKEIEAFLNGLSAEKDGFRWQFAAIGGLSEGTLRNKNSLLEMLGNSKDWQAIWPQFVRVMEEAERVAKAESQPMPARVEAIGLLSLHKFPQAAPILEELLANRQPQELQIAAVQALGRRNEPEAAKILLKGWKSYSPSVRREVLEAIFRQRDRLPHLLDALTSGQILPAELDEQRQRQLLGRLTGEHLERAKKLLGESRNVDRRKVVEEYREVLKMARDAERGQLVFQKNCATCHRFEGKGVAVGPDLADIRGRPEVSILEDLLDPNRALAPAFASYVLETNAGQIFTGVVATETATSVTLRRAEGLEDTILRKDIDALQSTGQSLMPEGLEKNLTRQELADLLGYLKGEKPAGKPK